MNKIDLNVLRDKIYKNSCEHKFQDYSLSNKHFLCLIVAELMKAVAADRGNSWNKRANVDWYNKRIESSRICKGLDPEIPKRRGYEVIYNETIKGSIEEALADSVIRLLDLAGLRSINLEAEDIINRIDDMEGACKDEAFTETIYTISTLPTRYDDLYDFSTTINDMIIAILGLAKHLNADLFWHIEKKIEYNRFCNEIKESID